MTKRVINRTVNSILLCAGVVLFQLVKRHAFVFIKSVYKSSQINRNKLL